MAKFPGWFSRSTQLLLSSPGQYLPSIFPTVDKAFCGAQGRVRRRHTCIPYIVKSKRGFMEKQVMQSRSKGASVWVDGWMDEYGLLLKVMSFLSRIIPVSLFFETWLPLFLSSFFLGHTFLACHLFFLLFGATIIWLYFRDVLREKSPRHGAFINVEWMVVLIPSVGI